MNDSSGFHADIGLLTSVANNDIDPLAAALDASVTTIRDLHVDANAVFGTHLDRSKKMGTDYDEIIDALVAARTSVAATLRTVQQNLLTIAGTYQGVEQALSDGPVHGTAS